MNREYKIIIIIIGVFLAGCKKLVEIDAPVAYINSGNVYNDNKTAISVLTGLYVNMVTSFTANTSFNISYRAALSADELTLFGGVTNASQIAFYKNKLVSNVNNSIGGELWTRLYYFIFTCNAAIEGLSTSIGLSSSTKQQLLGEAYFIRAFSYFYLVNLYGDAPLLLTTDPKVTASLPRAGIDNVYKQIVVDLKRAQELLGTKYLNGELQPYVVATAERVRPTKWAATALLARVYLFNNDYNNSELEASKVISETSLFDTLPLNQVFLKNSKEAIWQLQPIRAGRNSEDAFLFILPANGPNNSGNPVSLSASLLGAFESGDLRAVVGNWINRRTVGSTIYNYVYKYKSTTGDVREYPMVLRLAEQYLIRAEARAHLNKIVGVNGAEGDLNVIRKRAGLLPISVSTKDKMIVDILKERRVELFLEWGHRWLDIKRGGGIDTIMNNAALEKNTAWESYQQLYPLPFKDIQSSPFLKQNDGYMR